MIHLSRFLLGIRHTRVFRMKSLSGQLIDSLIAKFSDKFEKVAESRSNEEFTLTNLKNNLFLRINRDDILAENIKLFDWETQTYIEINKQAVLDIAKSSLPIMVEALSLKNDLMRIGTIFEFRVPKWESLKEDKFGDFIYRNFIQYKTDGEIENGAINLSYKLKVPGGGAISKLEDFRNVIININEDIGITEKGKRENCFFVSVDIQRVFKPLQKNIDIDDHYSFAYSHLTTVVLPELKAKGVDITI